MTRLFLLPFLLLTLALPWAESRAGQRVALVIGNGDYFYTEPLDGAAEDAADVADALRRLGFKVVAHQDLDRIRMERAFRAFSRALADAEAALFYYSGHSIQANGRNYLVPTDAELASDLDLGIMMTPLDIVIGMMKERTPVGMVFLDASRPNPLAENLLTIRDNSPSVDPGLAPINPIPHMTIAYSSQPDTLELERRRARGPFTGALLRHIETPEIGLGEMMQRVREAVRTETGGEQLPWIQSTLAGDAFVFVDPEVSYAEDVLPEVPPEPAGRVPAALDRDALFWSGIRESEDWRDYQAYLDRFGEDGAFGPLAVLRRDRLRGPAQAEDETAVAGAMQDESRPAPETVPEPAPDVAEEPGPDPAPEVAAAERPPEPAPETEPTPEPELSVAKGDDTPETAPEPEPGPERGEVTAEAPGEPEPVPLPLPDEAPEPEAPSQLAGARDSGERVEEPPPEELAEVPPIGEPWGEDDWSDDGQSDWQVDIGDAERSTAAATDESGEPAADDPLGPLKIRENALGPGAKKRIQEALSSLKHYDGPIDGLFGSGTRSSIKQFQETQKQAQTGYLNEAQQTRLFAMADAADLLENLKRGAPETAPETPAPPSEPAAEADGETSDGPVPAVETDPPGPPEETTEPGRQTAALPPPSTEAEPEDQAGTVAEQPEPDQAEDVDWPSRARSVVLGRRSEFEELIEDYNENNNLFRAVTSSHDTRIDRVRALRVLDADDLGAKIEVTVTNKARARTDIHTVTVTLDTRWSGDDLRIVSHR